MGLKKLLFATASVFAASAFAQAPAVTVVNVDGVVTATQGATASTVTTGSPILHGTRILTTSSGSVTLRFSDGCLVTLQPNQAVTVLQQMTCRQLAAAVVTVAPVAVPTITPAAPALAAPAVPAAVVGGIIGAGALALAAQIIRTGGEDDEPSVSPN